MNSTRIKVVPRFFSTGNPPWRILFFGSDNFSIFSLQTLTEKYRLGKLINNLEIVTTIRGKPNSVNSFSQKENLTLHAWPTIPKLGQFDVGVVVSFGHLIPIHIIENFEYGMINVHASLLPRWRGAAPIIHAMAKGDTKTGITIMKISPNKFDIGEIVQQASLPIGPHVKMGQLYTDLGKLGAECLVQTLENLPTSLKNSKPQPSIGITYAPKIDVNFSLINWNTMDSQQIYNLSRALDGVFHIQSNWKNKLIKLIGINLLEDFHNTNAQVGLIEYDNQTKILKVRCRDQHFITIENVGILGKKVMTATDFNNGFLKKEPPDCHFFT